MTVEHLRSLKYGGESVTGEASIDDTERILTIQ